MKSQDTHTLPIRQPAPDDISRAIAYPPDLPICEKREAIIRTIQAHQVIVVTGETGSGKSTQLPKMCLEAGRGTRGMIGSTQPRRIAAITLAHRVAEEMRNSGRNWVGYKIRFQDRTARSTRIKYMTDGILLAEAQRDRLFRAYDTLIIDEAHERSLNIDFILGLLKKILSRRPDLKVIVTSATLDPEKFSLAFDHAPIIEVSGRTYPVEVWHRPFDSPEEEDDESYIDQAVASVDLIKAGHDVGSHGDILIFMPTESDIRETVQRLEEKRYSQTMVLPLFGRLAAADQQRIFQLSSEEKIIVATNVAETSITIPRIRYVIDTGLARIAQYNPRSRTQSLPIVRVSRASADQRRGRCGRVEAGICIRLYSEDDYLARPLYTPPEILRSNLAEVILRMLHLRLGNIQDFPFLDPPAPAAIKDGFGILKELGAIDGHRRLTEIGRTMARLPLDPRLARMLISARDQGALNEMVILAAALSLQDPRERPLEREQEADRVQARFRDRRSDFVTLLRIWQAFHQRPEAFAVDESLPGLSDPAEETPPELVDPVPHSDSSEFPSLSTAENPPESPFEKGGQQAPPFTKEGLPGPSPNKEGQQAPLFTKGGSGGISSGGAQRRADLSTPSRGQMKKFCRDHFLSYRRMREWRDIHREIRELLEEMGGFNANEEPASYEAIHRSLLSGYLSHIAVKKEKNLYMGSKNRQLMMFPGSGLFNRGSAWIMAAEQVQTSRLFARTSAAIEPEWIEDLGKHLCRSVYSDPHWEKARGQVAAYERVILYGLTLVERRKVNYGRIKPEEAREIFIRSALIEGELAGKHPFLDHNRELIARIADLENKARRRDLLVDEETLFRFYDERLPPICDAASLARLCRDRGGDHFLRMTEADLLESAPNMEIEDQFPDVLQVGEIQLPLRYAFHPGSEDDGLTLTVPLHALPDLPVSRCEWLVPGLLPEKVLLLLKALPKSLRRHLVPVGDAADRLLRRLNPYQDSLAAQLSREVFDMTGVRVPLELWDSKALPLHLQMRFEVIDPRGRVLGAGRDLKELQPLAGDRYEDRMWQDARKRWEREGLTSWDFGGLPERIVLGRDALGLEVYAYPGLAPEGQIAAIRLFATPDAAREATVNGLMLLYQWAFAPELKQLRKSWIFPDDTIAMTFFMGNRQEATRSLHLYILRELFDLHGPQALDHSHFQAAQDRLRGRMGSLSREMVDEVLGVLRARHDAAACLKRLLKLAAANDSAKKQLNLLLEDLDGLVPRDFLDRLRRDRIADLPRYLKAFRIRAERAYAAPEKDRLKAEQVAPWRLRYEELKREVLQKPSPDGLCLLDELRWMVEEFKVSLFAPEIMGRFRISLKRLEDKFSEWQARKGRE